MQVYKVLIKILRKHLASCLIIIVIFLGFIMAFSGSGSSDEKYTQASCSLVIFDRDNSEASKKLTEYLLTIHDRVEMDEDDEQILSSLYFQEIDYVLYIEKGYKDTGSLTNIKRPGTSVGSYVDSQISLYEVTLDAYMEAGYSSDEAYSLTLEALSDEGLVTVYGDNRGEKPSYYYFLLYLPYAIMMVLFFSLCNVLVVYNRQAMSDRINVSPISTKKKSVSAVAAMITVAVGIYVVFIIFALVLYGSKILNEDTVLFLLNAFVFTILSAGIAVIAGNFELSQMGISMVANIVSLGLSFMGGIFVPVSVFGDTLKRISLLLPTRWYVKATDNIIYGGNLKETMTCIGVEALFAVAIIAVSMLISKRKRLARAE